MQPHTQPRRRGQSVVELVLLLPLLFMMILGMVDFALAFNTHTKLRSAVAEGGYWAAQNPGNVAGVKAQVLAVLQDLDPPIDATNITVQDCIQVDATVDKYETAITVRYDYPLLFGLFSAGSTIELSNSTTLPQFGGCR